MQESFYSINDPVSAIRLTDYKADTARSALERLLEPLGFLDTVKPGMRIIIKANLVSAMKPSAAATTHPVLLGALCDMLTERGATVVIGDSPGGLYTAAFVGRVYKVSGVSELVREGVSLNNDFGTKTATYKDAKVLHEFLYTSYLDGADMIINFCKIKSHGMMGMSCAAKNMFGTVPGVTKPEYHFRFPEYADFADMICDLDEYFHPVLSIADGVIGMEGNGPTAGTPRKIGALLMSPNPFASDIVGETILGFAGTVPIVREGVSRGLCPEDLSGIDLIGDAVEPLMISDFKEPDSAQNRAPSLLTRFSSGKIGRFFMPRPIADATKCRGCGECVASCPQHTIGLTVKNGKKIARIRHADCIRCYCCQELCPFEAIRIKKNFVIRLVDTL